MELLECAKLGPTLTPKGDSQIFGYREFGNVNGKSKLLMGMKVMLARCYGLYGLFLCTLTGGAVFYFTGDRNGRSTGQPTQGPLW